MAIFVRNRTLEAVGSIPISSTESLLFSSPHDGVGTIGAESFRILERQYLLEVIGMKISLKLTLFLAGVVALFVGLADALMGRLGSWLPATTIC